MKKVLATLIVLASFGMAVNAYAMGWFPPQLPSITANDTSAQQRSAITAASLASAADGAAMRQNIAADPQYVQKLNQALSQPSPIKPFVPF